MEPIDVRLREATEGFVLTVEMTEREIDLLYERAPVRAAEAMRRLTAVVEDTARGVAAICDRKEPADE